MNFLEANPDYAICFHRVYELVDDKQLQLSNLNTSVKEETYTIEDLAKGNIIHTPSVVFRNGLVKKFPEWFKDSPVGDYVLHMLNAKHGKIKYLPEAMAVYRRHAGGVFSSQSSEYVYKKWVTVLHDLMTEFDGIVKENLKKQYTHTLFSQAKLYLEKKAYPELIDTLSTAFAEDPENGKQWLTDRYIPLLREVEKYPKGIKKMFKYLLKEVKSRFR